MWQEIMHQMSAETLWFIAVIVLFNIYFHARFTPEHAQKAPAFLTTLGILGTFVGIALGLSQFDPDNVQKSVPALIGGIKTAVWASALGIFCALSIKFRDILTLRNSGEQPSNGATADDIADILSAIDASIAREGQKTEALQQSFERFYENITERSNRMMVEALGDIVRDFNGKISEQFGENFKRLNLACGAMEQVLEKQQVLAANSEVFSKTASDLSAILTGLERQRQQIESSLVSLATVLNTAGEGLPKLQQNVVEITQQLADTNKQFNHHMGEIIHKTKEQVLVLDAALTEELTKSLSSFGRQLASLSQKFAEDYGPITERLQKVLAIGK